MTPDYEKAAVKATETLIKYHIGTAPIDPLPMLKQTSGVLVVSFEEISNQKNIARKEVLDTLGCKNQDAVTTVFMDGEKIHSVVAYNRMLSAGIVSRALARELGHMVLGHDGSRPEEVRNEEAKAFAHHLLCPRALLHAMEESGIRLTVETVGNVTGFYDYCLSCIRKQPSVRVSADLNRLVRDQFTSYIQNLTEYEKFASQQDGSPLADLGVYMEGYEE